MQVNRSRIDPAPRRNQNSFHWPRLSPAQYSLTVQNHGLTHHSFIHSCRHVLRRELGSGVRGVYDPEHKYLRYSGVCVQPHCVPDGVRRTVQVPGERRDGLGQGHQQSPGHTGTERERFFLYDFFFLCVIICLNLLMHKTF